MKLPQKAQSYFFKKPSTFGKQSVSVNYTSICKDTTTTPIISLYHLSNLGVHRALGCGCRAGEAREALTSLHLLAFFLVKI